MRWHEANQQSLQYSMLCQKRNWREVTFFLCTMLQGYIREYKAPHILRSWHLVENGALQRKVISNRDISCSKNSPRLCGLSYDIKFVLHLKTWNSLHNKHFSCTQSPFYSVLNSSLSFCKNTRSPSRWIRQRELMLHWWIFPYYDFCILSRGKCDYRQGLDW
jgi:hypothetical protein